MGKSTSWGRYAAYIIVALVLLLIVTQKNKKYEQKVDRIFNLAAGNVTSFKVSKGDVNITLNKISDTLWVFLEPDTGTVNQSKIDRVLSTILDMNTTGYVTDKPGKYAQFNVDSTALTLEIFTADDSEKIIIGRSGSSWSQDYVRLTGNPKVFITREKILNDVKETADFWRQ